MTLWTIAHQAPLSMGFFRQKYWSGLSCPPPGDLSPPGTEPASLESPALIGRFFTTNIPKLGFPGSSAVKNPPAMQEMRVQSLGQEDPLGGGMQPTPVFLPGGSHGQRSLVGYRPWGCKELDMTEATEHPYDNPEGCSQFCCFSLSFRETWILVFS